MRKEFVINELLSVRFNAETEKTEVYVGGELFHQCKYILLVSPNETIDKEINSIDEAAEQMSHVLEKELKPSDFGITALEEFQAHCSNLQAWAENGYDARLLHSNLAFPLLEALAGKGDTIAQASFNSEVAARFAEGTHTTRQFIIEQGYLELLKDEELLTLYEDILCERDAKALNLLYKDREESVPIYSYDEQRFFTEKNGTIRSLVFELGEEYQNYLPNYDYDAIFSLKDLRSLKLRSNDFTALPEKFGELENLKILEITKCKVPESIGKLPKLEKLEIRSSLNIPESVGELEQLKHLYIGFCKGTIPESIGKLKQLQSLIIANNYDLVSLPETIGNLTQLEELIIIDNSLMTFLPKSLKNLENLKKLEIRGKGIRPIEIPKLCPHLAELILSGISLDRIPDQVWNYRTLKVLIIKKTQLKEVSEKIIKLSNLTKLSLIDNQLESIPTVLASMQLQSIFIARNPLKSFPDFLFKMQTLNTLHSDEKQFELLNGKVKIPGFKITKNFNFCRI